MKTFITTAIPYVNGPPHLGHAMEFVLADVIARYSRLVKDDVIFSIGTDEHGGKIAEKAEAEGISVEKFTDEVSEQFRDLAKKLDVSNDRFIRTTDKKHIQAAQKIWLAIKDDIYKKNYEAWYCTGDEAFFSDSLVRANNGICPEHNRPYEKIKEENYFFKLSKYNEKIKQAISLGSFEVIPLTKRNEILSLLNEGLEDISISRPKSKISWGIPVPDDDTQVIYVWFEALLNYITLLDYPEGQDFKDFWPAQYQVIGKDITRFHAAIWPGILLSLGIELPKKLYVHGFVYVDSQKMSKSLGNSIDPLEIVNEFGVDSFRYYFLRHIPSHDDGNFTWEHFKDAYQNELGNELGNAVQRTAVMVSNYLSGELPKNEDNLIYDELVGNYIKECRFDKALDQIWLKIKNLNQFIEEQKPWVLHKSGEHKKLKEVLDSQVKTIREISLFLSPFLPETSKRIDHIFGGSKVVILDKTLFPRKG
jgi:methionyl-tRNA synthetase